MWMVSDSEAYIGGTKYPISFKINRQVSLVNWQVSPFPKYSISLKMTKILNTVSHIHGSKMDSILYPWK